MNAGQKVNPPNTEIGIKIDNYGEWVVRVEACDAGEACSLPHAVRFTV